MKVVLPDNSELELPDGSTGLDAARAIGPKLADQAVLVRSDGRVRVHDRTNIRSVTPRTRTHSGSCGTPPRTSWPRRSEGSIQA